MAREGSEGKFLVCVRLGGVGVESDVIGIASNVGQLEI
jgi:hypothetical protein